MPASARELRREHDDSHRPDNTGLVPGCPFCYPPSGEERLETERGLRDRKREGHREVERRTANLQRRELEGARLLRRVVVQAIGEWRSKGTTPENALEVIAGALEATMTPAGEEAADGRHEG